MKKVINLLLLFVLVSGCKAGTLPRLKMSPPNHPDMYRNPVVSFSLPDPTVVRQMTGISIFRDRRYSKYAYL